MGNGMGRRDEEREGEGGLRMETEKRRKNHPIVCTELKGREGRGIEETELEIKEREREEKILSDGLTVLLSHHRNEN